jgi:phage terminase large subunit-like protein
MVQNSPSASRLKGRLELLAEERAARDLVEGPKRGLWFDEDAVEHAVSVVKAFRHSKGEWAGEHFEPAPWQVFIIRQIFGWKRKKDGTRRFRQAYIEVARKNGKSTKAAAIGHKLFLFDDEPGAEVYTAATKLDQAKIVHSEAVRMMKTMQAEEPEFVNVVRIYHNNMSSECLAAKYEPLGSDSDTLDGLNPHAGIIDEYHAHKDSGVYDKLVTGMGSRRQPMMYVITTAGAGREGACWEMRKRCIRILEGTSEDDAVFAFICTLDEGDDWHDERNWGKGNPNIGISVKLDYLRDRHRQALESVGEENNFLRFNMNVWTAQARRWLKMDKWDACAGEEIPPNAFERFRGRECWAGLDLASTSDLNAFVMAFPEPDGHVTVVPLFWIPELTAQERSKKDGVLYPQWIRDGWIRMTEGDEQDPKVIRRDINRLTDAGILIREIAMDRLFQGLELCQDLRDDGFEAFAHGQGFASMGAPTDQFEKLVNSGRLRHGGNPVLRWHAENVSVKFDEAGNIKPDRKRSSEKIDGIVAAIMATGQALLQPAQQPSVYEQRGALVYG